MYTKKQQTKKSFHRSSDLSGHANWSYGGILWCWQRIVWSCWLACYSACHICSIRFKSAVSKQGQHLGGVQCLAGTGCYHGLVPVFGRVKCKNNIYTYSSSLRFLAIHCILITWSVFFMLPVVVVADKHTCKPSKPAVPNRFCGPVYVQQYSHRPAF